MRYFVCIVLFSLGSIPVSAQDTRGTISGTVTDPQGGVLPDATVIVSNTGTGTTTRLATNPRGTMKPPYCCLVCTASRSRERASNSLSAPA
jgi:hypothetical protein